MKKTALLIYILFVGLHLYAQEKEKLDHKISYDLKKIISRPSADSTDIICAVSNFNFLNVGKTTIRILDRHASSNTFTARIATKQLQNFIANNAVEFADVLRQPKEELTTGAFDLTLNKINLVHHQYATITGTDIRASVKEQLLDSTDIDWKGRYFNSGVGANNQTSHASIMATILGGAGNSSPYALGAATGVNITSSNFASLLPDPDSVYTRYAISVQNHSYGTGIENFYGPDAKAYDVSINKNSSLLHVFSAGNSGTSTPTSGPYAGIQNFANITGSFKMAKNIITVGSVDSFNTVLPLSSRGPSYDGRVKPELVAYGEDGSSGAAALTSGTTVLLQQAYKNTHHDSLPPAYLIKAVLLNSADDVGPKGIDFTSGYGSLNAFNAMKAINENRFVVSNISNGEIKKIPITIPVNAKQIKLTVAWSDTAAAVNSSKALVNNIDVVLKQPSTSNSWLPWVLNSFPNKDSLSLTAVRKKDTLNTVEQITIDDPQPGNYLLEVSGEAIVTATQDFAIAYQIDTVNSFLWTYPTGTDILLAATVSTIHWQTNVNASAQIEYSSDNTNWQTIGNVNAGQQYLKWLTPDTLGKVLLRFSIPSLNRVIVSDSFVISKTPDLKIGFNCPDSFLLSWNKLPVAQYQLYQLGEKYMEPLLQSPDTIKVLAKNNYASFYYAVAPVIANTPVLRSYTLNYTTQGVGCYLRTFYATLQNNSQTLLSTELGTLYNVDEINFQQLTPAGYQTIYTVAQPSSLVQSFIDSVLIQGSNFYRLQIRLKNGQAFYSTIDKVYYLPGNPVLVFPNPARRNEGVKIVTQEPGIYTIQVFDGNGRLISQMLIEDILQQMPSLHLNGGMYFIKIISDGGKVFHQKLIVY